MIKYGLRVRGTEKVLGVNAQSNDGAEFCGSMAYSLDNHEDNMWLVDTIENALWVSKNTTPWYNASYDTPINNYVDKDIEVVEVEINVKVISNVVKLPSVEEVLKVIRKDDPLLPRLIEQVEEYSLYDYIEYLSKVNGGRI